MNKAIQALTTNLSILILGGCSVYMAASHEGVSSKDLMKCKTRECLVALGCEATGASEGAAVRSETFVFKTKRASATRAVMHGLLDVATLGLWEVAGTPIEATGRRRTAAIKVYYETGSSTISKIDLVKAGETEIESSSPSPAAHPAEEKPLEDTPNDDPVIKLRQLKLMLGEGLITQAEYDDKKEEILERWRTKGSQ
jgi:hypothetical protein